MQRVFIILITLLAVGCIKEQENIVSSRQRLVVDGRIEEGRGAVVALSLNVDFREEYTEDDFIDMVVRWAKVTVESENEREVLTGRSNRDYPTGYIYTGSKIRGEQGKSYTLIVEYSDQEWRATTTIPQRSELTDISVEHVSDTLYTISATLPPMATPCSIDCALNGSSYFAPTMLGVYDASDKPRRITINRPLGNLYRDDYTTHFFADDEVGLRINTLNDFGYAYWSLWQNNVINSLNPIFPAVDNLPSNISNTALGIWQGYNSIYYNIGTVADAAM